MTETRKQELARVANLVRQGVLEGVFNAKAGHPGGSLSAAEVMTYLYFEQMRVDPANPKCDSRDRFVLSKGHAAPVLYATLAQRGFFPPEELATLRKVGSRLQGHPSMKLCPGVDMSTGSLGQGISAAVGMALGAKHSKTDVMTYTLLGDGELQEGQVWEAAMFAAAKQLDNLVVIVDNNNLQIDGTVEEVNSPYPIGEKFAAFGFDVAEIDGHCYDALEAAFKGIAKNGRPTAIILKTVKGCGVSFMENNVNWHGAPPNAEQYETAMAQLKGAQA
ncbi:MAG: transketolase [Oscillospiraceae bacterium]|nr:transketolase [Oscillospiraceae bacterium]